MPIVASVSHRLTTNGASLRVSIAHIVCHATSRIRSWPERCFVDHTGFRLRSQQIGVFLLLLRDCESGRIAFIQSDGLRVRCAGERIELAHRALSRQNFAAGALRAARFVAEKRAAGMAGFFDMRDVLGLKKATS